MSHEITCARCQARDTVPFQPRPGSKLLCSRCHKAQRSAGRGERKQRLYSFECSSCGAAGEVPFKPRPGSTVLCRACMKDPKASRGGRESFPIECASCGKEDSVPFKPDPGSRVLCQSCHQREREAKKAHRSRYMSSHPRDEHGTRVRIDIRCDRCGAEDSLPFAPKTTGPILCRACAEKTFGERWARRTGIAEKEQAPPSYPFTCGRCGRTDFMERRPRHREVEDASLLCGKCEEERAIRHQERLESREQVSPFLYVNRGDQPDEPSS